MKYIVLVLSILFCSKALPQSEEFIGEYRIILGNKGAHYFEYILTLNEDGTFLFDYFEDATTNVPPRKTRKFGRGTWTSDGNLVSFHAEKGIDINDEYKLDFNGAKARFISKSPRDKSDRIIKTRLQFYKSGIFWMKGIEMEKI